MEKAFVIFLLLAFHTVSPATSPCNNFPLIFGGSIGDTSIFQIDIFDDYLAIGGST